MAHVSETLSQDVLHDTPVDLSEAQVTSSSCFELETPGFALVTPVTTLVTSDAASTTPDTISVIFCTAPVISGTTPVSPGTTPFTLCSIPVTLGTTPAPPGATPVTSDVALFSPGTAPVTPDTATVTSDTGTAPVTSGTVPVTSGTAPVTSVTAPVTSGAAPVTLGTALVTPNTAPVSQPRHVFTYKEGFFRLRNARLSQEALSWALRCVLNWSCADKRKHQSYLEYINGLRSTPYSNKDLKGKYFKDEIKLMNDTTPEHFDATMLYKLITTVSVSATPASEASVALRPGASAAPTPCVPAPAPEASTNPTAGVPASVPGAPAAITPEPTSLSWARLTALLEQCKEKRNAATHDVATTAVSESYLTEAKPLLWKLLDTAADYFGVPSHEKMSTIEELENMVRVIEHGVPIDVELCDIREKFLTQGKSEMKTKWSELARFKLLLSIGVMVDIESIYNPVMLKMWKEARASPDFSIRYTELKAEVMFDKCHGESRRKIKLLSGDGGSGKSFLTRLMFLSWLGLINIQFSKLEEFELLVYMECRDDRHESLKELIEVNYPDTCAGLDMDKVVDSFTLAGSKNLFVVDGADERNVRSNRLLKDILEQLRPNTMNECLITSRPHEVESVKRLLNSKLLSYQGYTIMELSGEQQVETLVQFQKAVDHLLAGSSSSAVPLQTMPSCQTNVRPNIVECFKRIEIKNVFRHPLSLLYFCDLCLKNPDEVVTWTGEADVLHAMYGLYMQVALQKLEENNCAVPNLATIIRNAFAQLAKYSLMLFQNEHYHLTEEQFDVLKDACYEVVSRDVDYKTLFSNILWCETDAMGRNTGIYNFPHRSTQEHLQALAVIAAWEKNFTRAALQRRTLEEKDLIARAFAEIVYMIKKRAGAGVISTETGLSTSDFSRYEKTIQFIILELLRARRPHTEDNIKNLFTFLRFCGLTRFEYIAGLVSSSGLHPLIVHEAAVAVDTSCWIVRPMEISAADLMLAVMQQCAIKYPHAVHVYIHSGEVMPEGISNFLSNIGDIEEHINVSLYFFHAVENFMLCDDLLDKLKNRRVLSDFCGCLHTPGRILAPLLMESIKGLELALMDTNHDLDRIRDCNIMILNMWVRCPPSPILSYPHRRPLPRAEVVHIYLIDVPAGEREWPYRCLTALVPVNNRYDQVALYDCRLSDADLDELRQRVVQTVAVRNEENSDASSDGETDAEDRGTHAWRTICARSDGSRDIIL